MELALASLLALRFLAVPVVAGLGYLILSSVYNIFFHPLAKFPGPFSAAVQDYWLSTRWLLGNWPADIEALHAKYGDVVRIAPNELSFSHYRPLKDIYGQTEASRSSFTKDPVFYNYNPQAPHIISAIDPAEHQQIRKALAPGFTASTILKQSDIVTFYVDLLIEQFRHHGQQPGGINVPKWFMWLTFDTIADLTFGENMGDLQSGESCEWFDFLVNLDHLAVLYILRRRLKSLRRVLERWLVPAAKQAAQLKFFGAAIAMTKSRIARGADIQRHDLFTHLMKDKKLTPSEVFLAINGSAVVVAGTETTAISNGAITYYLLQNPVMLRRAQDEVRAAFKLSSDINGSNTKSLPYLNAVIEEALRLFSPAPFGLPRVSPGALVDGHWIPKGTVVQIANHVTARDERFFHKAKEFHPERWLPTSHQYYDVAFSGDKKEACKPFAMGSRTCIGIHLSYMEMRICMAKLLWNFDWETANPAENFPADGKLKQVWKPAPYHVYYKDRAKGI